MYDVRCTYQQSGWGLDLGYLKEYSYDTFTSTLSFNCQRVNIVVFSQVCRYKIDWLNDCCQQIHD